jgi:AcrR family transcriptional regulator
MARQPQKTPRKTASQKRSRVTVDTLLEATARVLVKEGYERASTNRIAAVAGVSVGSLYQYFPGKEALIEALIGRHTQELSQVVRAAMARVVSSPLEVAVRELVAAAVAAHSIDPKLHRVLAEEVPRTGRFANITAVERSAREFVRAYLEGHRTQITVADLDLAAFTLVTTIEALTHSAVLHRPELLAHGKTDGYVDEVTRLALAYLRAPTAASLTAVSQALDAAAAPLAAAARAR